MDRRTSAVALAAAFTLAACSPDVVIAPANPITVGRSAISAKQLPNHIVLVNENRAEKLAEKMTALGGSIESFHAGAGLAVVSGLTEAGASDLALSGVGEVHADVEISIDMEHEPARADASDVENAHISSQEDPSTAGRIAYQWNMQLIKAPAAWAAGKLGSANVTVAILDTGIDYGVPDMGDLVDLARSTSFMTRFVGQLDNPLTPENEYDPIVPSDDALAAILGTHRVMDFNGHGTNVATQVSSKAFRLAGVTSRTKLMGVKVLGANGSGTLSGVLNGLLYAADNGADVANMSLGGAFSKSGGGSAVAIINRVFNYARQKGMLIVVAAGNSGMDLKHNANIYSTYCDAPHVICVSSVGPTVVDGNPDLPAFYTNFGKNNVDIAAPGGNAGTVRSRWPWSLPGDLRANDVASFVWSYCARLSLIILPNVTNPDNGDLYLTTCSQTLLLNGYFGTSQASPHVAGLAALLVAELGKGNPDAIKKQIQRSADPVHPALGHGRINVQRALGL